MQGNTFEFSQIPHEVRTGPFVTRTKLVTSEDPSPASGTPLAEMTAVLGLGWSIYHFTPERDPHAGKVSTVSLNPWAFAVLIDPYVVQVTVGWGGEGPKAARETGRDEN